MTRPAVALAAAAEPKPTPGGTAGFESVSPIGPHVLVAAGACLILLVLVLAVLSLRAPRAGMAGKAQLRRQLGPAAMLRGAAELRPGGPTRPAPLSAAGEDTGPAREHVEKGDPRCLATERR